MAQTINTITNNGIFQVCEAEFTSVSDTEIKADLSHCKEPITVIIDVPSDASDAKLICNSAEKGFSDKAIQLIAGKLNVFRMETKGFKDHEGFVTFATEGLNGAKIAFLKYSAVINH